MKLLIGGSPCTYWSIARMNGRETVASGLGWELFKKYLQAREMFQPDYFLYENNKSISVKIQNQISRELGMRPILIDSALVSAQHRERLYWTNIPGVTQPADKGLLLWDVVFPASEVPDKYWYDWGITYTGRQSGVVATVNKTNWLDLMRRVYSLDSKSPTLNTVSGGNQQAKVLQNGRARKLMPEEYARLQTVPDTYRFSVSNGQMYRMLGNGWTIDVISHILSFVPGIKSEVLDVLSLFDGMACGRIALDKLGINVGRYRAFEIDKYAIKTACENYPDIEQMGNVMRLDEPGFVL